MTGRVAGKTILISGAARGMGAAHARRLVAEGARVALGDVLVEEAAALASELGEHRAFATRLDVTELDSWQGAVAETTARFGHPDVLINNAGIYTRGNAEEASVGDWKRTIDIDLTGVFLGTKAVVPGMKAKQGGSIINISSIAGLVGFKNRAAYAAAKWGVVGLTKTSALDFGEYGIRVNAIHPGSVRTPLTAGLERGFGQIAMGRDASPDEVSSVVLFLASDESSFCNGGSFAVDGGETAGNNLRADA
ncbi:SDR family oxidoreductase [Microbacterium sp. GXF7504]